MRSFLTTRKRRFAASGVLLFAAFALYAAARDREFEAAPYLAYPGAGRVAIRGITKNPCRWQVVPLTPGSPSGAEVVATTNHFIEFTKLPPDRVVEMEVLADGVRVPGGKLKFRTEPGANPNTFDFVVIGDSGGYPDRFLEVFGYTPSDGAKKRPDILVKWISEARPQLFLHAGDVAYPHGERFNYVRAFFRPFGPILATTPIAAAIGNHDLKTSDGAPFLDVFGFPNAPVLSEGKYYSFDYGPLHVSVLDSNEESVELLEQQAAWFRKDLQNAGRPWKIVLCHVPLLFNSEAQRSQHSLIQQNICDTLRQIAEAGSVTIIFSGHRHWYERSHAVRGMIQIITGGGGADIHDYRKYGEGERAKAESYFHFVKARVTGDVMTVQAIRDNGEVIEDGGGARIFRRK
ncbi:MAG: metallophosphoesterase family protein [Planctomycetota bacterium]